VTDKSTRLIWFADDGESQQCWFMSNQLHALGDPLPADGLFDKSPVGDLLFRNIFFYLEVLFG
jgi:hypothetical protein